MRAGRALALAWLLLVGATCLLPGNGRGSIASADAQALTRWWGPLVTHDIILAAARRVTFAPRRSWLAGGIDHLARHPAAARRLAAACALPQRTALHLLALAWWLGALYPLAWLLRAPAALAPVRLAGWLPPGFETSLRAAFRMAVVLATLLWSGGPVATVLLAPGVAWLWILIQPEPCQGRTVAAGRP